MKLAFAAFLFLLLAPGLVVAQAGGAICFFSDSEGTECTLLDNAPGILTVHVVHSFSPGATAIQFSAPKPACMVGATWVKDTHEFPVTIGNSQWAVSVGYGTCMSGPIHVLSIEYVVSGTTTSDCAYRALPAMGKFDIEILGCSEEFLIGNRGTTYINSSRPCECLDAKPAPPLLSVSPGGLTFGPQDVTLPLEIRNAGGGALSWQILRDQQWILLDPPSGTGDATVMVTVNRSYLYSSYGVLSVVSNGGTAYVGVSVSTSRDALLYVSPTALDLGESGTSAKFTIQNIGKRTLNWTISKNAPWLFLTPMRGTNSAVIYVTVKRADLPPGAYSDIVNVTSNGGNADVTIAMTVAAVPVLEFTPPSLFFPLETDSLPLSISNGGQPGLEWSIASNRQWLDVSPASGTDDAEVVVTVDRSGLGDETLSGALSIASNGGSGTVAVVINPITTPVEEKTWGAIKALFR